LALAPFDGTSVARFQALTGRSADCQRAVTNESYISTLLEAFEASAGTDTG
jgi:hypothetical protein